MWLALDLSWSSVEQSRGASRLTVEEIVNVGPMQT